MKGNDIRRRFLEYFAEKGHTMVDSSSLVPKDDPTLLFTNAGMVQFKTVFMGDDKRPYNRAVTSQRCVRAGGKHNDLENVGYTARHHTFFEMLGNFSFGDYFKEDAIRFAWDFLTKELKIDPQQLWVSIFDDDDEAYELWEKVEELPKGRIVRMGEKDNFWAMGDTGPCGPCSEIHIDQGAAAGCGSPDCALGCDCDRFLELWNLVFMQFNRDEDGNMTRLPKPSIDTGMGLERVAAVLQGKFNNYESDLFTPVISGLELLSGKKYGENGQDDTAMRVIADHARATTFLVADGVLPSNEGRGYVLRRIMRRAIRYGKHLGLEKPFMDEVTKAVIGEMKDAYPHLLDSQALLTQVTNNEEARFRETLEHGLQLLDQEMNVLKEGGQKVISGPFIFKLYDTFGFPFDIVRDIALEHQFDFDEAGFLVEMEEQRKKSRQSRKDEGVKLLGDGVRSLAEDNSATEFLGYTELELTVKVGGLLDGEGKRVSTLKAGTAGVALFDKTPCYAESGGQVGDHARVTWESGRGRINRAFPAGDKLILHDIVVEEGELSEGGDVAVQVDRRLRRATEAHHSSTHLLHEALKRVLGDHVKQAGSLVGPERLRFDFTHFSPVDGAELVEVEKIVNQMIRENLIVNIRQLAREEALKEGATALFGEKYGDTVRVVSMGDFSMELCGGTHVKAAGEIGLFKILSETGIAAGVRRIEALAGAPAFDEVQAITQRQKDLCSMLSVSSSQELLPKLKNVLSNVKSLERQVAELAGQLASSDLDSVLKEAVDVDGIQVVAAQIPLDSPKTLREVGDKVRDRLTSGIAVLGGEIDGKAALLAIVSKDLTSRIKAGALIGLVAKEVGGKGGGRPDMAQAGGPLADKIPDALKSVVKNVRDLLQID